MTFQWPWQFDFPPFFTIQPNLVTREKQLQAWCRLVIDYCQFHRIYSFDLNEVAKSELFYNGKINRRLDETGIRTVFNALEQQKHVEWTDKGKNRCHVYWRRPDEWGQLIYEWASSNGLLNSVFTLHDLVQGEDTANECSLSNKIADPNGNFSISLVGSGRSGESNSVLRRSASRRICRDRRRKIRC
jgi:ESCRT-II complex subunit VPS25